MDHRERFFKALRLEQPDRVPYFDIFDEESILKIGKHFVSKLPKLKYSVDYTLDEIYKLYNIQFKFMKELEIDAIMVGFFSGIKRIPGTVDLIKDRYGIVYKLSKHGESVVVDGPIKNESDLRKFRRMRPAETDFALLEYAREREPERVSILSIKDSCIFFVSKYNKNNTKHIIEEKRGGNCEKKLDCNLHRTIFYGSHFCIPLHDFQCLEERKSLGRE